MYDWFGGLKLHHCWEPITASSTAEWRRTHILAHLLGGMVWDALMLVGIACWLWLLAWAVHLPSDWQHALLGAWAKWGLFRGARVVAVGLKQLCQWEAVQHENWRPELTTPPGKPGTGYPWLSAGWDVIFTISGAVFLEAVLALLRAHL